MPPNLRSRQILLPKPTSPRRTPHKSASTMSKILSKGQSSIEPSTPDQTQEASALSQEQSPDPLGPQSASGLGSGLFSPRRSVRLSGKLNRGPDSIVSPGTRQSRRVVSRMGTSMSSGKSELVLNSATSQPGEEDAALGMVEVIRVSDTDSDDKKGDDDDCMDIKGEVGSEDSKKGSKRKLSDRWDASTWLEAESADGIMNLSLGLSHKVATRLFGDDNSGGRDEFLGSVASPDNVVEEGPNAVGVKGNEAVVTDTDQEGGAKLDNDVSAVVNTGSMSENRKFSTDEKGKGKLVSDYDQPMKQNGSVDLKLKLGIDGINLNVSEQPKSTVNQPSRVLDDANGAVDVNPPAPAQNDNLLSTPENAQGPPSDNNRQREYRYRQFREIARETASKFARVNAANDPSESDDEGEEVPSGQEAAQNIEDWPGPYSSALKIIRDREKNINMQTQKLSNKSGSSSLLWKPKTECGCLKDRVAPSLQDLCLKVLAKNSDAIPSLEYVPDALRNKLSRMICDSRKMSGHFLDLLFEGSSTEIRVADCSWITEEQFAKSFQNCDTRNLMVLDLNQCGRCMPDYTLKETLASKGLPVLTTISLKGACRLSDTGLSELVLKAPSLRSINLSQCSLLTDVGIYTIAESLGSVLRELYLDDCQSLNSMLILPALQKMNLLEVLSLVGIPSVSNAFLKELVKSNGHGLKELMLANCIKLTDKSLKLIGETCSGLHALDLRNVCKLSDSGIGYITNGCPALQKLKLCRQLFSDEAVAAFVETHGEFLLEFSLNSVLKVGTQTAISIGRNCKNMLSLDVSWCRNLTDEHLGLIADSCLSLRVMNAFGCQMTDVFLNGHSNPDLHVIGAKLTPILEHMRLEDLLPSP